WAMGASQLKGLGEYCGLFRLMDAEEARRFCGHERQSAPIKVIEDGVLFTRIECLLTNGFSSITVVYTFPKSGADFDVRADVDFLEKDKILRFCLPVKDGELYGQTAFGFEELEKDGREFTFQKWLAERGAGFTFGVLNDGIYAGCCDDGEIQLTLLRSAAYCAHPIGERPLIPQDRYSGRLEQGRHTFEFRICAGGGAFENLERKAKLFNEKPYALSVCPQGNPKVKTPVKTVSLSGSRIDASCIKYSKSGGLIVRLVNCSDSAVCSELSVAGKTAKLSFGVFEVKTVKFESGVFTECALMEI
ncbi:MAG: hypothetical protein FWE62_00895, partial [Firmicutes bacterium]|nr:hypothetical protein [Bacillota bacterium]